MEAGVVIVGVQINQACPGISDMDLIAPIQCPGCGGSLNADAKFCQQCGLNLASAVTASPNSIGVPASINCSYCNEQINPNAAFCSSCGHTVGFGRSGTAQIRKPIAAVLVCLGAALVYILVSLNSNGTSGSSPNTTFERNLGSVVNGASQSGANKLTNDKVEAAINQLTNNLRVGGSIGVEGIQELPQENAAHADLRFINFQYKSDLAGAPVSNDKQSPKKPEINAPKFYDQMYRYGTQQVQIRNFSGQGYAVLKHYSDGRWVLKEVHWGFNGWLGNVDIR